MSKNSLIKVGFCVSYDWELLKKSIPRIYETADVICLSIDRNRRSWSGLPYEFDDTIFNKWIEEIDVSNKIRIYEDDFSLKALSPIENDNRQRNLMAKFMGEGGWHIQIDSDEYFIDFKAFVRYLRQICQSPSPIHKPYNVCCNWVPLIKKLNNGYVYVEFKNNNHEVMPFATNRPEYTNARRNGHFNVISNFFVLHETWARGEEQLWQKINSWGHHTDFANKQSYFNLWKAIDAYNCQYITNFHPIKPEVWPSLAFCEGNTIDELIQNMRGKINFNIPASKRYFTNSRNFARLRTLMRKFK